MSFAQVEHREAQLYNTIALRVNINSNRLLINRKTSREKTGSSVINHANGLSHRGDEINSSN